MKFQNPILNLKQVPDHSHLLFLKYQNLQRAITQKIKSNHFLDFYQVILSLSSISRASLKLPAVMVFEISSFLCPKGYVH